MMKEVPSGVYKIAGKQKKNQKNSFIHDPRNLEFLGYHPQDCML